MIDLRIKYNGVRVRLRGFGQRKLINLRLLETGLKSVRGRLARGLGSDDEKTQPLTKYYARYKSKRTGRAAIRDLRLTGEFLDNFLPRYADDSRAAAYSRGRLGRMKAIKYRDLINFSATDQRAMSAEAKKYFRETTTQIFEPLTGDGRAGVGRFKISSAFRRAF